MREPRAHLLPELPELPELLQEHHVQNWLLQLWVQPCDYHVPELELQVLQPRVLVLVLVLVLMLMHGHHVQE